MASLPITAPGSWVFSGDVPSVFVDHARHSVPLYDAGHDLGNVEVIEGDLAALDYRSCDIVIAYLTMHFLPPGLRLEAIRRIYQALRPGGAYFMVEKVLAPGARSSGGPDHHAALPVQARRGAEPGGDPQQEGEPARGAGLHRRHLALMQEACFTSCGTILKYLAFEGFIAVK